MRTFVDQPTQIFNSDTYNDALTTGISLQTSSVSLEDDLNALRTQVRQLLWANVSGSWYDTVVQPSSSYGIAPIRGVNTLGQSLALVEQHRFLYRRQVLDIVSIGTGSNLAILSVSLGNTPQSVAVVDNEPYMTGTIVASIPTIGTWSVNQISGSTVLTPKNLVVIRDAYSHTTLTTSLGTGQKEIYGLLQCENGTLTGESFNDVNKRAQISFVYEKTTNNTSSLEAVPVGDIGGRSVNYTYITRVDFASLPEDAYLSNNIFIDIPQPISGGGGANLSDITLQRAINNQGASLVVDSTGTNIQLANGTTWTFLNGTTPLWNLASNNGGLSTLTLNLYGYNISSSLPAAFQQGVQVATGSTQINVGVTSGQIDSLSGLILRSATGNTLIVSGGSQIQFGDGYGGASTYPGGLIPFATSTLEWSNFYSSFGNASVLGAMTTLSSSITTISSASLKRYRAQAGTTGAQFINAGTNVTYPTNIDAPLLNYAGKDFVKDINIYLNGILLVPGNSINQNDVYPGTSAATGDLRFPMKVRSGSIITMEIFSNT